MRAYNVLLLLGYMAALCALVATASGNLDAAGRPFPAVSINIGHGHNGFVTAALLGGALLRSAMTGVGCAG